MNPQNKQLSSVSFLFFNSISLQLWIGIQCYQSCSRIVLVDLFVLILFHDPSIFFAANQTPKVAETSYLKIIFFVA